MKPTTARPLAQYHTEISPLTVPSRDEELALAQRVRAGDDEARSELIERNLKLVSKIAGDFAHRGLPIEDLVAEGNIGLMKAVDRFDPDKGAKLSTYAAWWIKQCMRTAIRNQSRTIRLPSHIQSRSWGIYKATAFLEVELGRTPSDYEIAEHLELSVGQVREAQESSQPITHLESQLGDDSESTLYESIADESVAGPDFEAAYHDDCDYLGYLIDALPERDRQIIRSRFALNDDADESPKTLGEVGKDLGVCRERIRQLQNNALSKLRTRYENPLEMSEELVA